MFFFAIHDASSTVTKYANVHSFVYSLPYNYSEASSHTVRINGLNFSRISHMHAIL